MFLVFENGTVLIFLHCKPIYMQKETVETCKKHSRVFLETLTERPPVSRLKPSKPCLIFGHCN